MAGRSSEAGDKHPLIVPISRTCSNPPARRRQSRSSNSSNSSYGAGSPAGSSLDSNSVLPNSMLSAKSRSGLPECATQQVCNAIFVRMNHTQRLCECSPNYNWKCSNNLDPQDGHTIELTRKFDKRVSLEPALRPPDSTFQARRPEVSRGPAASRGAIEQPSNVPLSNNRPGRSTPRSKLASRCAR